MTEYESEVKNVFIKVFQTKWTGLLYNSVLHPFVSTWKR